MNKIAVIFDMDGVLIDSQDLHYQLDMQVLKSCGYPATLAEVTPYTGLSTPDRWPKYQANFGLSQPIQAIYQMVESHTWDIFKHSPLVPISGIPALLDWLKGQGIYCGIASSSSIGLIQLVLEKTNLTGYFSGITSGEDVENGKPAPDVYLNGAKKAGLPPKHCIGIEDSPPGLLAAKRAGLTTIGYQNANTCGQDFSHAHYQINDFAQCKEVIRQIKDRR